MKRFYRYFSIVFTLIIFTALGAGATWRFVLDDAFGILVFGLPLIAFSIVLRTLLLSSD